MNTTTDEARAALLAAAVLSLFSAAATAQVHPEKPTYKYDKCYGVAMAGKNDCAATGNNSCGGTSKLNGDPKAWIYVPEGYCERIIGGSKTPK